MQEEVKGRKVISPRIMLRIVPSYIAEDEYSSYIPILKGMGEAEIYEWLQSFIKENLSVKQISPQNETILRKVAACLFAAIQHK